MHLDTTHDIRPILPLSHRYFVFHALFSLSQYEYYEDPDNIYLILEFCDGGELFDRLHQQKGNRYSEAEAARLMFKMWVFPQQRQALMIVDRWCNRLVALLLLHRLIAGAPPLATATSWGCPTATSNWRTSSSNQKTTTPT